MRRSALLMMMVVAALLPTAAFAQAAQQNPQPGSYPIRGQAQVLAFGAQRPGANFDKNDCGFLEGQEASISINGGAPVGTDTVERDGCVKFNVTVVNQDTISFTGTTNANRTHPAQRCRENVITITGPVASGAPEQRQVENRFTIACAAAAALPRTGSDIGTLVALGAVLIVVGATVVTIVRRRRRSLTADTVTA